MHKIFWILVPEEGAKIGNFGRIWSNFEFTMFILWLGHSVPIKPSTVNTTIYSDHIFGKIQGVSQLMSF